MSTQPYNPANDPENNNTDGIDQTPSNDNQELDKINDAVQAAEPSFTLNYDFTESEKQDQQAEEQSSEN